MPHLWTITSLSRPLTKQKRPTISRERFFRAAKSFSGPIIAIASNLPNAHFHKQTRSSDLFGKSEISLQVLNTSYITSEIVPVKFFANLSHGSNLGLLMPYFWIWESALPFVLANYPAVFLSYFSLWICYETQLTNTKIKISKTSRLSRAIRPKFSGETFVSQSRFCLYLDEYFSSG